MSKDAFSSMITATMSGPYIPQAEYDPGESCGAVEVLPSSNLDSPKRV
jgi:hypothetical protein